jgi:hypothetical protein
MNEAPPSRSRNVALLIDADNASPDTLDPVLTVLAELGTVNVRRVYGNWSKPALKGWVDITHTFALEPQQQFDVTKGKSATDMKMIIDAMDLLYGGRVHGFGIMSSDSDFMALATRIRQDGLDVYGFGEAKTPISFKQACTRFIDVGALREAEKAANAPPPAPPRPARARAEAPAEEEDGLAIPQGLPPPIRAKVDDEVIKLLGAAFRAAKRDEKGWASIAEVGKLAGNRSSFDARNYGFARLSDLIETLPNFATEKRQGGAVFVKRVR